MSDLSNITPPLPEEEEHTPMCGRFSDAVWYKPGIPIVVGGLGNIGSWLVLMLSKLEPSLAIYDMDTVEEHNVGVSSYTLADAASNTLKTTAAANLIANHSGIRPDFVGERYDEDSMTDKIVFSCFDNMTARDNMFKNWLNAFGDDPEAIFIDGRSSMEYIQVYAIVGGNQDSIKRYKEEFFSDDEDIPDLPCNMKSSSHMGAMIGALMTTVYTNHITNVSMKVDAKVVPFYTEFTAPMVELVSR